MKNIFIFLIYIVAVCSNTYAQQIFEDASGESTFYTDYESGGWVKFNSASTGFNTGYTHASNKRFWHNWRLNTGLNLKVTAKDGIGTLFKGNQLNPGVSLSTLFGMGNYQILKNNSYLTSYIRYTGSYNNYKIINDIAIGDPELVNKNAWGHQVMAYTNIRINGAIDSNGDERIYHFIGLSAGFKNSSNYSTLEDVQIATPVVTTPTLAVSKIVSGKIGPYAPINSGAVNLDYGFLPRIAGQPIIGINAYFRGEFWRNSRDLSSLPTVNPTNINVGVGIFFAQANKPSSIVGGMAWQFNDTTNGASSEKTQLERSSVFFYIGYTIP